MSHDFEPTQAEKDMMSMMQSSPAPHTNYERITENKDDLNIIVELLADIEHERWAGWQAHLHSKLYEIDDNRVSQNHHLKILPTELYDRWERQIATPYSQLTESEKESDRNEVKKTLRALVGMGYMITKPSPKSTV
jgi:hypothetical protein